MRISKDSLTFFNQFKPVFFQQILSHYKNLRKFLINLNFIFEEKEIDSLLDRLAQFQMQENVRTIQIEDGCLNQSSLSILTRSGLCSNIIALKMPRNNLGDSGVAFLFSCDRLTHLIKIDISSNQVTEKGAEYIAQATKFTKLEVLDLRNNRIGN